MICPKCRYEANESDPDIMPGVCPACGIAYEKWLKARAGEEREAEEPKVPEVIVHDALWLRLYRFVSYMPRGSHKSVWSENVWLLALIYAGFFLWGWSFILGGVDWNSIGGSFLHDINLPFHEFGHVLFSPFGDFMMLLGGSLFQVLMPLGIMLLFMIKQRDNFSASIMLWWSGQNFIDVSPYIADAPTRYLPLVGNRGPESHDWWNLLAMSGSLGRADLYAGVSFGIGAAVIILSNVWGVDLIRGALRKGISDTRPLTDGVRQADEAGEGEEGR